MDTQVTASGASRPRPLRRVRHLLSGVLWRLRSRRVPAPRLPAGARSVLFVCKGNICRSPFAEGLARRVAAERGWTAFSTASVGLEPSRDGAAPEDAVAAAAALGVDLTRHRPAPLTDALVKQHDLVVVMDWGQFAQLRARYAARADRIVLLSLFAADPPSDAYERLNVADPFGRGPTAFERCYARLSRAVTALVTAMHSSAGA